MARDVEIALAGCDVACRPAADLGDDDIEAMFGEIAKFIRLVGGGWPPEDRADFIAQASADLADIPASLLGPALYEARRRVRWNRDFVPWVHEHVARSWERLREERRNLAKLAEIAREKVDG